MKLLDRYIAAAIKGARNGLFQTLRQKHGKRAVKRHANCIMAILARADEAAAYGYDYQEVRV